jgi:hypothetical protein
MHCQTLISFMSLVSFVALIIQVKSLEYVSLTLFLELQSTLVNPDSLKPKKKPSPVQSPV